MSLNHRHHATSSTPPHQQTTSTPPLFRGQTSLWLLDTTEMTNFLLHSDTIPSSPSIYEAQGSIAISDGSSSLSWYRRCPRARWSTCGCRWCPISRVWSSNQITDTCIGLGLTQHRIYGSHSHTQLKRETTSVGLSEKVKSQRSSLPNYCNKKKIHSQNWSVWLSKHPQHWES